MQYRPEEVAELTLELQIADVDLVYSEDNVISIHIKNAPDIKVNKIRDGLVIKQPAKNRAVGPGGTYRGDGMTIRASSFVGCTFGSGSVIYNNGQASTSVPSTPVPEIVISVPRDYLLKKLVVDSRGNVNLVVNIDLASVELNTSGNTNVRLNGLTDDLNLDSSGNSEIRVANLRGTLNINTSGNTELQANLSNASRVMVNSSGNSDITTSGTCLGDYSANASGMSKIRHRGKIHGRVSKCSSGMSKISV